jgi:hypothetical protein
VSGIVDAREADLRAAPAVVHARASCSIRASSSASPSAAETRRARSDGPVDLEKAPRHRAERAAPRVLGVDDISAPASAAEASATVGHAYQQSHHHHSSTRHSQYTNLPYKTFMQALLDPVNGLNGYGYDRSLILMRLRMRRVRFEIGCSAGLQGADGGPDGHTTF